MVLAYILIISESGAEQKVVEALAETENVHEADLVYGEYDIIAKISLEDISQIADFVVKKIRTIFGVKRTSTLIAAAE